MVNESDQIILATTYLRSIQPFLEGGPLPMHTAEETEKIMKERVRLVEESLKKPKIKAIYEKATLANPDDKYLIDTIGIVRALERGDRAEAGKMWLKLLGVDEE